MIKYLLHITNRLKYTALSLVHMLEKPAP